MTVLERVRLKNIIILILALLNCFLIGTMALRHLQADSAQDRMALELSRLFASDGIMLDAAAVPPVASPATRTPVRNTEEDKLLAAFFLGDQLTAHDEGGGIYTCRSSNGEALGGMGVGNHFHFGMGGHAGQNHDEGQQQSSNFTHEIFLLSL